MTGTMTQNMVVQYGFRDDDDEESDEEEYQEEGRRKPRGSLFGGLTRSLSKRGNNKLLGLGEGKGILGGSGHKDSLYHLNADSDEEDSDDDHSVSSKASVASRASQAMKKLGGKIFKGKKQADALDIDDEELSDEDFSDDGDNLDASKSSVLRRVSCSIKKALVPKKGQISDSEDESEDESEEEQLFENAGNRRNSRNFFNRRGSRGRHHEDEDEDEEEEEHESPRRKPLKFFGRRNNNNEEQDEEEEEEEEEEQPRRRHRRQPNDRAPKRSQSDDYTGHRSRGPADVAPTAGRPRRNQSVRETGTLRPEGNSSGERRQPRRSHPGDSERNGERRAHRNNSGRGRRKEEEQDLGYGEKESGERGKPRTKRRCSVTKYTIKDGDQDSAKQPDDVQVHDEGHVSDLSDDDEPQPTTHGKAPSPEAWSMNVTPEMLDEATAEECNKRGKDRKSKVPGNIAPKRRVRAA